MVEAYWNIGKSIVEQQGGEARAEYGAQLIKALSKQMTADFGKGFPKWPRTAWRIELDALSPFDEGRK